MRDNNFPSHITGFVNIDCYIEIENHFRLQRLWMIWVTDMSDNNLMSLAFGYKFWI